MLCAVLLYLIHVVIALSSNLSHVPGENISNFMWKLLPHLECKLDIRCTIILLILHALQNNLNLIRLLHFLARPMICVSKQPLYVPLGWSKEIRESPCPCPERCNRYQYWPLETKDSCFDSKSHGFWAVLFPICMALKENIPYTL